ncbi:hypothetical protein V6N13_110550 [Hibiscus sabdariffa]
MSEEVTSCRMFSCRCRCHPNEVLAVSTQQPPVFLSVTVVHSYYRHHGEGYCNPSMMQPKFSWVGCVDLGEPDKGMYCGMLGDAECGLVIESGPRYQF